MGEHAEEDGHSDDRHCLLRTRAELFQGEQCEDQRGEPSGSEPADEQHCVAVEAGADAGQGDGHDPHEREAQGRVEHDDDVTPRPGRI